MNERRTLFFEPLDVLQFRDNRPFDAGFNDLGESRFPLPAVFLGCLRTALFTRRGADFSAPDEHFGLTGAWERAVLGGRTRSGALRLRGPLLARIGDSGRPEALLPAPRDLVKVEENSGTGYRILRRWAVERLQPDLAPARLHWNGEDFEDGRGALPWTPAQLKKEDLDLLLTPDGARAYLEALGGEPFSLAEGEAVEKCAVLLHEDRIGIARDAETRTAEEHMLYLKRPFRLAAGAGFAVDVEVPAQHASEVGGVLGALHGEVVPLGGKGHRARVRVFPGPLIPTEIDAGARGTGPGKLWLLTPVVPPSAWPEGVAGLVTGRSVSVSGYDLARRAPKPLRRALPAGTVVYIDRLSHQEAIERLCPSEEDRRAGYGTALLQTSSHDGNPR